MKTPFVTNINEIFSQFYNIKNYYTMNTSEILVLTKINKILWNLAKINVNYIVYTDKNHKKQVLSLIFFFNLILIVKKNLDSNNFFLSFFFF